MIRGIEACDGCHEKRKSLNVLDVVTQLIVTEKDK